MTGSVQHGAVVAVKNSGKSKFYKILVSLSCGQLQCFNFGSRKCDGGCMLCGRSVVIDEPRQIGVIIIQK